MSPVTAAGLAEVAGLREVIVVIVAELGVGGVTARAREVLLFRQWRPGNLGLGWPTVLAGFRRRHWVVK